MSLKIIILTGSELRHTYFRKSLATIEGVSIVASYCESAKGNLQELVASQTIENTLRTKHLELRDQSEKDFFEGFCLKTADNSNPIYVEKGAINDLDHVEKIKALNPDVIVSYGCSIIKSELLTLFKGRFINLHLGLSPYYRGSGTNFWPFVNNELQFVGVTFMHIDAGIDTGAIIHQIRAEIKKGDTIHTIGNRLIRDMTAICGKLLLNFRKLEDVQPIPFDKRFEKIYRKKDFTETSLEIMYQNFELEMVEKHLQNKAKIEAGFPIITNKILRS